MNRTGEPQLSRRTAGTQAETTVWTITGSLHYDWLHRWKFGAVRTCRPRCRASWAGRNTARTDQTSKPAIPCHCWSRRRARTLSRRMMSFWFIPTKMPSILGLTTTKGNSNRIITSKTSREHATADVDDGRSHNLIGHVCTKDGLKEKQAPVVAQRWAHQQPRRTAHPLTCQVPPRGQWRRQPLRTCSRTVQTNVATFTPGRPAVLTIQNGIGAVL